jgi:hypothetical protein
MPHTFKDRDIRRLVKAARGAGLEPFAVEVDIRAGTIRVLSKPADEPPEDLKDLV